LFFVIFIISYLYGFLRGDNYLSSPKDVYISPIQIRRFKLDTGDIVKCSPLTSPTNIKDGNFSPSFVLEIPFTISPVSSLNLLIWIGDIYTSFGLDK